MLYRPKHCCECGEKIDRGKWKLLTSRRFCEICESEFKTQDWLPRAIVGFGLLTALFGVGNLQKKSDKPLSVMTTANASIASSQNQNSSVSIQKQAAAANTVSQSNVQQPAAVVVALSQKPPQAKPALTRNEENSASEITYFCGAQTKKGTPCTRRVKGAGRCWQHVGQPAMMPREKLVATR